MATMLQNGSAGEDVKKLQKALLEKGYDLGSAGADGIFGAKTESALRQYQKDAGLTVDGIAGEKTLGSLYAAPEVPAAPQTPQNAPKEEAASDVPVYTPSYEGLLNSLEQKLTEGQNFSYRLEDDPLYHQYRAAYLKDGALAARDSAAKAAAATGGYGNSYAEAVSQQTLQSYLDKLYSLTPELAQTAYDRHQDEQDLILQQYKLVQSAQEAEYDRYRDALQQYRQQQQDEYDQKQDQYKTLQTLIKAGYQATDAELSSVGMTRQQANALLPKVSSKSSGAGYDNGGYTEDQIKKLQRFLGVTADGKFGSQSKAAMKEQGYSTIKKAMEAMESRQGYFTYDDDTHSQLNAANNGQSMYSMVVQKLKEMHAQKEPLSKVADYLGQMVGGSYITRSEYLQLYNRYRDHNL